MVFFQKINRLILLDKVESADIRKSLNILLLLLRLKRLQLRYRQSLKRTAKNCCVQHPSVRDLEFVLEFDGEITLTIFVKNFALTPEKIIAYAPISLFFMMLLKVSFRLTLVVLAMAAISNQYEHKRNILNFVGGGSNSY